MNRIVQLGWLASPYAAALAALGVAGFGMLLARRRPGLAVGVGPLTALAGFAVLVPMRAWLHPGTAAAALVGAAGLLACAGLVRGRVGARWAGWLAGAALLAACWWVAAAAGGEVWRGVAGMAAAAVVLARIKGSMEAGGLALCGGLVAAGVGMPWTGVGAVLAAACLGPAMAGVAGLPGVLAVGLGAVELGAGRLGRGRFGTVEVACCAAICAPLVAGWIERGTVGWTGQRRWVAQGAGAVGAGLAGFAAAWVWSRAERG